MMSRYKPTGWRNESYRHYLAAKGVKTRHSDKVVDIYGVKFDYNAQKDMNQVKVGDLRKAYEDAHARGEEQFTFQGHQFLTKYAYYMLQHVGNIGLSDRDVITLTPTGEDHMASKMGPRADTADKIMKYEEGKMTLEEQKEFFQYLVDSGLAWHLQGEYGRTANEMLESGMIHPPKESGVDAYGNKLEPYYEQFDKKNGAK